MIYRPRLELTLIDDVIRTTFGAILPAAEAVWDLRRFSEALTHLREARTRLGLSETLYLSATVVGSGLVDAASRHAGVASLRRPVFFGAWVRAYVHTLATIADTALVAAECTLHHESARDSSCIVPVEHGRRLAQEVDFLASKLVTLHPIHAPWLTAAARKRVLAATGRLALARLTLPSDRASTWMAQQCVILSAVGYRGPIVL
jgi:hypothetical protein